MEVKTMYAFPCRRGCGKPTTEGKACCSQECRDRMPNCKESGCQNATEPITYQGQDYAGFTDKCYRHGGRAMFENEVIEEKPQKVLFVNTVKGWLQACKYVAEESM
jgi:hypothetical protein